MSTLTGRLALMGCLALASLTPARGQTPAKDGGPRTNRLGDPLPEGTIAGLGTTRFRRLDQWEDCVGFAPDGNALVCVSDARRLLLHRVPRTYRVVRQVRLACDTYAQSTRRADGRRMVCSRAGDVTLMELTTGKEVSLIPGREIRVRPSKENPFLNLASNFSRDGRLLAFSGDGKTLFGSAQGLIRAWDVGTTSPTAGLHLFGKSSAGRGARAGDHALTRVVADN
jgi:hypothetical protein